MYKIILISIIGLSISNLSSQQYFTKTGTIKFFSHTNLEDIKAENRKVLSIVDSKTGALEFAILMKSFDFSNDLMEQHFNETYIESSKFPKAGFKGRITDISMIDFNKDGIYLANYIGKLTIKDVTKEIAGTASFTVKDGKLIATTHLKITPSDYNISIPATATAKISKEIDIDIFMDYSKKMKLTLSILILIICAPAFAQKDTSENQKKSKFPDESPDTTSMLDDFDLEEGPDFEQSIFKGTRVINSNSTEMIGKKNLDFRICHRFGFVNSGSYELFGLDQALQRMSFTYGISDLLNIEIGRSSVNKVYDASIKYKFMRQAKSDKNRPLSIVYFGNIALQTLKNTNLQLEPYYYTHRLYYTHQLLVSRKITDGFSIQLMPTLLHRNLIDSMKYKNDVFSLGIAGRNKISRKTAVTYEYFYVFKGQISTVYHNSLSIGFDIETGGHVFQIQFTNSTGMNEKGYIAETAGDWLKGDVHFGFNISRVFYIGR